MEHRILDDKEFEELWQTASARGRGHRLAEGYTQWAAGRRRARNAVFAAVAVVAVSTVSVVALRGHSAGGAAGYDAVYCNRGGASDTQWAALAGELLMEA